MLNFPLGMPLQSLFLNRMNLFFHEDTKWHFGTMSIFLLLISNAQLPRKTSRCNDVKHKRATLACCTFCSFYVGGSISCARAISGVPCFRCLFSFNSGGFSSGIIICRKKSVNFGACFLQRCKIRLFCTSDITYFSVLLSHVGQ